MMIKKTVRLSCHCRTVNLDKSNYFLCSSQTYIKPASEVPANKKVRMVRTQLNTGKADYLLIQ